MQETPLVVTRNLVDVLAELTAQQNRLATAVSDLNKVIAKLEDGHTQLSKDRDYLIRVLIGSESDGMLVAVSSLKLAISAISDKVAGIQATRDQNGRAVWQAGAALLIAIVGAAISALTTVYVHSLK